METYYLNGKKYYHDNGKWLTSGYMSAPISVVGELNKLLLEKEDISSKSVEELISIVDGAKKSGNTLWAIMAGKRALEIACEGEVRNLLSRVTSTFRMLGRPREALDTANLYIDRYGKTVLSPALYTSMAAAYIDLGDVDNGRLYANKAKGMIGNGTSYELIGVYQRLKSLGSDLKPKKNDMAEKPISANVKSAYSEDKTLTKKTEEKPSYSDSDWKLFREKLSVWQENHMARLCREYIHILSGTGNPSERIAELEKRTREDFRHAGVRCEVRNSKDMLPAILRLINEGAIELSDLVEFSPELRRSVERVIEGETEQ